MASTGLKSFGLHSMVYALGNILNRVGGFLLLPLYLNYLSPAEFGMLELFYVTSVIIGAFIGGGLAHGTLRFYFEYDDPDERRSVVSTTLIASTAITVSAALFLSFFAGPISRALTDRDDYAMAFHLILVIVVMQFGSEICLSYFRARNYSHLFVIAALMKLLIQIALNIYTVVYLGNGVPGVLFGNMCGVGAAYLLVMIVTLREVPLVFSWPKLKEILSYTYPMVLSGVFTIFLTNADRYILKSRIDLESVAFFSLGYKIAMILLISVTEPFRTAYGSYRFAIMKRPDAQGIQQVVLRYYCIVAVFASLGLIVLADPMLKLISKEVFWQALAIVPILVLARVLDGMGYIFHTGMLYEKKTGYSFLINAVTGILHIAITWFLVQVIGIWAPAFGGLARAILVMVLSNVVSQRLYKVEWEYFKVSLVFVVAFGLGIFSWATGSPLAVNILLVGLFPVIMFALGVITRDEFRSGLRSAQALRAKLPIFSRGKA